MIDDDLAGLNALGPVSFSNAETGTPSLVGLTAADLFAELDRIATELRALPPSPVRVEAPSEVIAEMDRALATPPAPIPEPRIPGAWASIAGWLPVERNDDLPARSYRVHMSDGSTRDEKMPR